MSLFDDSDKLKEALIKVGLKIVFAHRSNPKGCKESSRWSESAETTGKAMLSWVAPWRGARFFDVKIFYVDL